MYFNARILVSKAVPVVQTSCDHYRSIYIYIYIYHFFFRWKLDL